MDMEGARRVRESDPSLLLRLVPGDLEYGDDHQSEVSGSRAPVKAEEDHEDEEEEEEEGPLRARRPASPAPSGGESSELRRFDRNAREQKRSQHISEQIQTLRSILVKAGMHPKNSKYSVLSSSAQYIGRLRSRTEFLEAERTGFANLQASSTNAKSRHRTTASHARPVSPGGYSSNHDGQRGDAQRGDAPKSRRRGAAPAIDYRLVFECASTPLAICALDGRFVDVNAQFASHAGYAAGELKQLTVFNLTSPSVIQHTYTLISDLLKRAEARCQVRAVLRNPVVDATLAITLVRNCDRNFEYFLVTLIVEPLPPFIP